MFSHIRLDKQSITLKAHAGGINGNFRNKDSVCVPEEYERSFWSFLLWDVKPEVNWSLRITLYENKRFGSPAVGTAVWKITSRWFMAHEEESEELWNMRSFGGHPRRGLERNTSQLVSTIEDDGTAVRQQMNVLRTISERLRLTHTVSKHTCCKSCFFKEMAYVSGK